MQIEKPDKGKTTEGFLMYPPLFFVALPNDVGLTLLCFIHNLQYHKSVVRCLPSQDRDR